MCVIESKYTNITIKFAKILPGIQLDLAKLSLLLSSTTHFYGKYSCEITMDLLQGRQQAPPSHLS